MEKEPHNQPTDVNGDDPQSRATADVTPEWLAGELFEDLLKDKFPEYKSIAKFAVRPGVKSGENFMTLLQRIHLDVVMQDATKTAVSYMVKTLPTNQFIRNLVQYWQIFDKESCTYNTYLPAFEEMYRNCGLDVKFGPKVFQLPVPVEHEGEILVMEDLRPIGFTNIKRQEGMDKAHTEATLRKVAQLHAASAVYYDLHGPYPQLYDKCYCCEVDESYPARATRTKLLRECLPLYGDVCHLDEKLHSFCELACDPNQEAVPQQPHEFYVLNHGDLWSNNVMFRYDDSAAIKDTYLLDYQLNLYGSPAVDLYYLLLSSTNLDVKVSLFEYFVSFYHGELVKCLKLLKYGKKIPTLRDIHVALYRHGNWAYSIVSDLLPIILSDQSEDINVDVWLDDKNADMRRKMYRSQRYIDHMTQLLPWLETRGLLNFIPEGEVF
ncbi:uncharacterized protein LOC118735750 isoform X1 [Rhagoletis pomonella]|uniref:uncharacterized protein LOC118735750 isoform X1 n=1 Tax=Rhagoletis pomonella TaxID=28610 RepID=UPI00178555F6|nr:uncharacterized protein LOC118735750 isoform X1 [Rhagoletis pomonella]